MSKPTKVKNEPCPCGQCILIPICRHKEYYTIFEQCILISEYIPNHQHRHIRNMIRIRKVFKLFNPDKWSVGPYGDNITL